MARTLVTGGNGFVGSALVRLLAERGDDLRLTVRRRSRLDHLAGIDYDPVECDVTDRAAVRRAMRGVDRVFHVASLVSLRAADSERLFEINVGGTRTVLAEALRAGVERVVYTSSVAAIGPAERGRTADERQIFTAGHLGIPYVNSKHEAEVEAMRLAAQGLPLVVVNPTAVFGWGDVYGNATSIVRRFLLGRIPAYAGGALNIVDVEDVARGHLLADEQGQVGERYILGNRNYTLDRLFADLARLSGVEAPPLKLAPRPGARGRSRPAGDHLAGGARGERVVDLSQHEGEARARVDDVPARGRRRGDGRLVPRARGGPAGAFAPDPAGAVEGGRRRAARRAGVRRRRQPVVAADRVSQAG